MALDYRKEEIAEKEAALSATLAEINLLKQAGRGLMNALKFYAIELDAEMVVKSRTKLFDYFSAQLKECNKNLFSTFILARIMHEKIEHKDFFDFMKGRPNGRHQGGMNE